VEYDAASQRALAAHFSEFRPADRAELLGDQFAMFLAGREPLAHYLAMLPALGAETNIAVWQDTIQHLEKIDGLIRGTAVRRDFRAFALGLLNPEMSRLGWDAKPGENFTDALLRPDLIAALGRFGDAAVTAEAHRRFIAFIANPGSLAPDLREAVLNIVGREADQQTYDQLRKLGEQAPGTEEKLRYFTAMASARDPKLVAETVSYAGTGQMPNGRIIGILAAGGVHSDDPDQLWHELLTHQAAIRAHLGDDDQPSLLPEAANASNDPAVARALLADPASSASSGARIMAAEAAESVNIAAELQKRAVPELGDWLKAHGHGG
jgi:aminopeptidase N